LELRLLLTIRANHAGAGEVFLRPRGHRAEVLLHRLEPLVDRAAEPDREDRQKHHGREREQRQATVDAQHEVQRENPTCDSVSEIHDGWTDGLAHRAQVVREASHDVTGSRSPEVACVESQEMGEEVVAEVVFYSSTETVDELTHSIAKNPGHESETDHCAGERPNASRFQTRADPVERGADQPRRDAGEG